MIHRSAGSHASAVSLLKWKQMSEWVSWVTRCDRSHTDMSESSQISLPAAHRATQLRRNIGIITEKLDSARIFFAQIQLLAETHPARYRTARTDENSSFPLFDLRQVLHTNRSSLRRRGW